MSTSDEPNQQPTPELSPTAGDEVEYEFRVERVMRGREASTKADWQNRGWEFVTQSEGLSLRREITFRRVRPEASKTPGMYMREFAAQGWAAFRRLESQTQRRVLVWTGGLLAVVIVGGFVAAMLGGDDESEPTTSQTATSAAPSEDPSAEPSAEPSDEPTSEPEVTEPVEEAYVYDGPKYEIVTVDDQSSGLLMDQYWVHTKKFDHSTDAYKEQIKLIFTDIARSQETARLVVQVVTDKEIIEAESVATMTEFGNSHDADYWKAVMVPKEASDWVASYTGGLDYDTGELSDADTAFGIDWWPGGDYEAEKWKPEIGSAE